MCLHKLLYCTQACLSARASPSYTWYIETLPGAEQAAVDTGMACAEATQAAVEIQPEAALASLDQTHSKAA